ncbi:hypothetical protein ACFQJC_03555 [Haloferax namakaokahaiae]|uniref:Uncharacterized protein n=1 Tax=Haloferax namakaokahaiae TaxID=1748331 RepID=A0ABD5ZBM7_9EURY
MGWTAKASAATPENDIPVMADRGATLRPDAPADVAPARDTETESKTQTIEFTRATATVSLDCTDFSLRMEPASVEYYLGLLYRDEATDEVLRSSAGPLTGRVADSFGDTEFMLLEIDIQISGEQPATVYLPDRCFEGGQPRSEIRREQNE